MRRSPLAPVALAALLTLAVPATRTLACSQCLCGSPTPPGYLLDDATHRFEWGLEDRFLSKENALFEEEGDETQTEHRVGVFASYRPMPRLALRARLPWVWKKNTERPAGGEHFVTRSDGLGDADVLARMDVMRFGNLFSRRGVVAAVASVTVPTGDKNRKDALGDKLEPHLQPGTGAWSGTFGVASDLSLISSSLSASVLGRVNGESEDGYRYGDVLMLNAGYARTLSPTWQAAIELNARAAEKDHAVEGGTDPNTGGTLLYLAPSLRWGGFGPLALDLMVQIPVAGNLYGTQTEHATARLAAVWIR